jgi:peptide/nickel transport system substrate-binding protein
MFKKKRWLLLAIFVFVLVLAACQPEAAVVEVTRVVENTVVETRVVEVEGGTEIVEVTRVVTEEVAVEPTAAPAPQGGNVVESSFADANTLNPVLGNDQASADVYTKMFLGLTGLEEFTGFVIGQVAESWDVSEDGLVYTFHLRDDIVWSDGTSLTADDVVFTFDAINNEAVASPRRSNFAQVESWEAVDDHTVELRLTSVDCTILTNLVTGILPAHVYENDPTNIPDSPENSAPSVVSGPFTFGEWVADDHITLEANPDYYLGKPNVDTWTRRVYADQSAEFAALLAGEVEAAGRGVGTQFVSAVEGQIAGGANLNITKFFNNGYNFIGLNLADPDNPQNGWEDLDGDGKFTEGEPPLEQDPHPVLSDLAVRQAIAYATDYTGLINQVAFGQGGPIVANVWPSIEWAYNNELEAYAQDLEMAQAILDEAGWVDSDGDGVREKDGQPLSFSLMTNAGNETRENIGIVMKDVLDGIGFDIQLDFLEFGTVPFKPFPKGVIELPTFVLGHRG